MNKKEIRKHHLQLRMSLAKETVIQLSSQINLNILKVVAEDNKFRKIGLFYPYKNEVDVLLMTEALEKNGFYCLLPKVRSIGEPLDYYAFSSDRTTLVEGFGGIMEPIEGEVVDPDIIIASCSAFNEKGYRVGYGGGFFDRTIEQLKFKKKIVTILAAFEVQRTNYDFQESHDQKVDYICTENKTYQI